MKKILISFCATVLVCTTGFQAQANTIITNAGPGPLNTGSFTNIGYDFTVGSNPLLVTALGLWDGPTPNSIGDGFVDQHEVGLWTNNGSSPGTLLAMVTIPAGTTAPLIGDFRYVNLVTPVTLLPGTSYVLGAFFLNANDNFISDLTDTGSGPAIGDHATYDPAVMEGQPRSETALSFGYPRFDVTPGAPGALVGPNAIFTPILNGVPESGTTAALMLVSLAALLTLRRAVRV